MTSKLSKLGALALLSVALLPPASAQGNANAPAANTATTPTPAPEKARWFVQTSVGTVHFNPDPAHNNHQRLLNFERHAPDNKLIGFAVFDNSFGQPSQMFYVGKRWMPLDKLPGFYLKLIGGVLHGYKGEYRDKIPFNGSGVAPVIIPAVGWQTHRFAGEMILFGNSGAMWTLGYRFD